MYSNDLEYVFLMYGIFFELLICVDVDEPDFNEHSSFVEFLCKEPNEYFSIES